jgi:hypothetical protein
MTKILILGANGGVRHEPTGRGRHQRDPIQADGAGVLRTSELKFVFASPHAFGDWRKRSTLRHLMAEQGAQRRGADHRIHAGTSKRHYGPEFCTAAPVSNVAAWILGSPRRHYAAAPPVDDEVLGQSRNLDSAALPAPAWRHVRFRARHPQATPPLPSAERQADCATTKAGRINPVRSFPAPPATSPVGFSCLESCDDKYFHRVSAGRTR